MINSEILKEMLKQMEENHINLYHDVTKQEIEQYVSSLNLDSLNDVEFDYEMLKLFNKFKDAHTSYFVPFKYFNKKLFYIDNKLYIKDNNQFYEVVAIGKMPISEFILKLTEMLNYETQEYLWDSIRASVNNRYFYEMLGLCSNGEVEFSVKNNNSISTILAGSVSLEEYKQLGLTKNSPFYSYKILNEDVLYIKYRKCVEHEDYKFSQFVEELKQVIETNKLNKYVLDLRDNHGGNSSIIHPLIDLIKEQSLNGILIIDNGVFSSGRWAIADFKKNFNVKTVGEPTGGAAASYGYNKNLQVEDKRFSVSIRFWDFSDVFGTSGTIKPDVYVPFTFEDLKNGTDTQLEKAILELDKQFNCLTN